MEFDWTAPEEKGDQDDYPRYSNAPLLGSNLRIKNRQNIPDNDMDDLEVEVYYQVVFKIRTWDGTLREHRADLPGHVRIIDLKTELAHELGAPNLSEWTIARTQERMSDGFCIYRNYNYLHEDEIINVFVHSPSLRNN